MQLFSNNKNKDDKSDNNQEFVSGRISSLSVAIMSNNQALIDDIRAILFLYNVLRIEVLPLEFDEIKEDTRWSEFDIFIIDIRNARDAEEISSTINRYIPIKATTVLIGENDSIIFADILSKKGIHFLLKDKQLEQIPNILSSYSTGTSGSSKRTGSVVSFLGCKGGVGNSSLIVHVLKNISSITNYPILYIQGASTSPNADFLFELPINKDGVITPIDDSIQVKIEQESEIGHYDYLDSGSFNITILDQNIGLHSSFNRLENIIKLSNIVFLVVNRDPYSIKVAKMALEEINQLSQKDNLIQNKRFLVCVNENQPFDKKSSLQDIDISEYIGKPIDFIRHYIPVNEKFKKAHTSSEIRNISAAVIGIDKEKEKTSTPMLSLFKSKKSKNKKR